MRSRALVLAATLLSVPAFAQADAPTSESPAPDAAPSLVPAPAESEAPADAGVSAAGSEVTGDQPDEPGHVTFVGKEKRTSYLIPALESEALHMGFLAFSNLVSRQEFAQISTTSIASHFNGNAPWQWDVDYFLTNQFGHPYQGALAFTAARSAGVPFWLSCLYPFFASLTWELFYEVDAPSMNDMIMTTFGGIFLGEVLHRAALLVLTDTEGRAPSWGRKIGAFFLSPMDTANSWLTNDELYAGDIDEHVPYFAQLSGGVALGGVIRDPVTKQPYLTAGVRGNFQGRLTYGIPGDPDFKYRYPFSHFDLDFTLTVGSDATAGSYFSRGLLVGTTYGSAKSSVRGLWGLFGQYDYSGQSLVRIASVGLGIGTSLQWKMSTNAFLQATGVFSGVPFATAGSLGLDEDLYRDYHIGPGFQALIDLRLIHRNIGWLKLTARNWFVVGAYVDPPGWESITYLTVSPMVRLLGPVALGADLVVALRRSQFEDATFDRRANGFTAFITLSWLSDWQFGIVDRTPKPGPQASARR